MLTASQFPTRLTVELTNACNYSCSMCPSRHQPGMPRGLMSAELFRRLVDQAAGHLPVTLVPFFRGESTLHPQLPEFLALAKQKGLGPIQLASNAALLDETLARRLLDLGLDFISFSLDTVHADEYAAIRLGGDLDRVTANVLRFLELRDQGGHATQVQVSATRTETNRARLADFVARWRPLADRVRIYYEHSKDGHPGSLDTPEVPADMPRRPCHKVYQDMLIYHDGQVGTCNHDWDRQSPLGDANRQTLAEIWRGPAYRDLRAQHEGERPLTDPTCRHCDHWKLYYLNNLMIGELYERA